MGKISIYYRQGIAQLVESLPLSSTARVQSPVILQFSSEQLRPHLNKIIFVLFRSVFGVYLEIGKQSMLQPIYFWKDLFEIYPKRYGLVVATNDFGINA